MPKNKNIQLLIAFLLGALAAHLMHGGGIPGTSGGSTGGSK
jgi:hypothetical protein